MDYFLKHVLDHDRWGTAAEEEMEILTPQPTRHSFMVPRRGRFVSLYEETPLRGTVSRIIFIIDLILITCRLMKNSLKWQKYVWLVFIAVIFNYFFLAHSYNCIANQRIYSYDL